MKANVSKYKTNKWILAYSFGVTLFLIYFIVQSYLFSFKLNHSEDIYFLLSEDVNILGQILNEKKINLSDVEGFNSMVDIEGKSINFQILYINIDSSGKVIDIKLR
ncbi:hypothetical protein ACE193_22460 [Bernardetia sp. OM2101]|uniref:hypothetical protein n=1 Tax=Bernardetia sp. OM2101 TaxID=3344876 RepID=UPI0035D1374F